MRKILFRNFWITLGLIIIVIGWGPLWSIVLLDSLGLWPNPNPNPIGPGFLFGLTFLPAVICLAIGIGWEWYKRQREPQDFRSSPIEVDAYGESAPTTPWYRQPVIRIIAGLSGIILLGDGVMNLTGSQTRGAASAIVIGVVIVVWASLGRLPAWFKR